VILVCNQPPNDYPNDSRVEIIADQFAIPKSWAESHLDQKLKVKRGMIACKGFGEGYVMRLDSDDFIHQHLVAFVRDHYGSHGWYISQGYVYTLGKQWIFIRHNFHLTTASSHIVWLTEEDLPNCMETPDTDYFVDLWQHLELKKTCQALGRTLQPVPFRAGIYTVDHSENLSPRSSFRDWYAFKKLIWQLVSIRPLQHQHIQSFGLPCYQF
jgi:hypothetical protein